MAEAVVMGGLTALYGVRNTNALAARLTFNKYNYGTNTYSKLRCFTPLHGGRVFLVPRHFPRKNNDLGPFEYSHQDSLGLPLPPFVMRPEVSLDWRGVDQERFIADLVKTAQANQLGGYGISPCGTGKTLMGLEVARRLGRSVLVILSQRFQPLQWYKELRENFVYDGEWDDIVGIYQASRRDRGKPITFGTINSLLKIRDSEFFEEFGTTIFDEGHHLPADSWLAMAARLRSRYIFALTASFHRTDNLEKLFEVLLGDVLSEAQVGVMEGGEVMMLYLAPFYQTNRPWGKRQTRNQWATAFAKNELRNTAVVNSILKLFHSGRNILVFSDIREHLQKLYYDCAVTVPESFMGFYMGGMSDEALQVGGKKRITFITYGMGKESLNLPKKDSLVCATPPPSNLKQLKGRVDRAHPDPRKKKLPPVVVDFVDPVEPHRKKGRKREFRWNQEGLTVKSFVYGGK